MVTPTRVPSSALISLNKISIFSLSRHFSTERGRCSVARTKNRTAKVERFFFKFFRFPLFDKARPSLLLQ